MFLKYLEKIGFSVPGLNKTLLGCKFIMYL